MEELVPATCCLEAKAVKYQFTIPLRIKGLRGDPGLLNQEQLAHRDVQLKYRNTLQCIGNGIEDNETVILMNFDPATCKRSIFLPG